MDEIIDVLKYRATYCKRQSAIHRGLYRKWNIANIFLHTVQLGCTMYIASAYYMDKYVSGVSFYDTNYINAILTIISTIVSIIYMGIDVGKRSSEYFTASMILRNIY